MDRLVPRKIASHSQHFWFSKSATRLSEMVHKHQKYCLFYIIIPGSICLGLFEIKSYQSVPSRAANIKNQKNFYSLPKRYNQIPRFVVCISFHFNSHVLSLAVTHFCSEISNSRYICASLKYFNYVFWILTSALLISLIILFSCPFWCVHMQWETFWRFSFFALLPYKPRY